MPSQDTEHFGNAFSSAWEREAEKYAESATELSNKLEEWVEWIINIPGIVGASVDIKHDDNETLNGCRLRVCKMDKVGWTVAFVDKKDHHTRLVDCGAIAKGVAAQHLPKLLHNMMSTQRKAHSDVRKGIEALGTFSPLAVPTEDE